MPWAKKRSTQTQICPDIACYDRQRPVRKIEKCEFKIIGSAYEANHLGLTGFNWVAKYSTLCVIYLKRVAGQQC